ncbi:MAG: hypothetical protein J5533_03480 [Bacteroidales bacterium]|nr:hypothetical protein [Bacteroidales bacterium]
MKKIIVIAAAALIAVCASAQEKDSFLSHMFLPVDAGISFSSMDGIDGAFYMRASLEYRFNIHKGPFILAELDTRTHPYSGAVITTANVAAGDAAFTDILLGAGWRFMLSPSFKLALGLQGGASNMAYKEVSAGKDILNGKFELLPHDRWAPSGKASLMIEYYLNPSFDLFLGAGLPITSVPYESSSMDPIVFFPTVSLGFNMALE